MELDLSSWLPEFPIREHGLYLDHAGLSPLPRSVATAMTQRIDDQVAGGHAKAKDWEQQHLACRHLGAQLIGCEAENVSLVASTSDGLSLIANGLPWHAGDQVLVGEEEFASTVAPWLNLADRGVEVVRFPQPDGRIKVEDVAARLGPRTRVLVASWVAFHSGWVAPLEQLGRLAREVGTWFVVDGVHGLGVVPLVFRKLPVDALVAGAHTWLLGPPGVGLMATTPRLLGQLQPPVVGWHNLRRAPGDHFLQTLEPVEGGQRLEAGSGNEVGLAGLAAALDLITTIGVETIHSRVEMLSRLITRILIGHGWEVYSPGSGHPIAGIVAARHSSVRPREVVRRLAERKVVAAVRQGYVRFSPHFYTTRGELEAFDRILEKVGL